MSDEEIRTAIALVAIAVSACSFFFARRSWHQSNRPIVTAFVAEHAMGNQASTFDLIVSNTGSRPAIDVRLHAKADDIAKLLTDGAPQKRREWMDVIFSEESRVPLLRNGEELRTSFGAYAPTDKEPWLNYGAEIPITIMYSDLAGHAFSSALPLRIYARNGFGGGNWS